VWSLLPRKAQVTLIVITGVALAWSYDAVYAYFIQQHSSMWKSASFAATIIGSVLILTGELIWRWLWRKIPLLQIRVFPDLNGLWKGNLVSTWIDPATGEAKPPIPTEITIRQKLFSTSVTLKMGESQSHSTRCILEPFYERRTYRVWYSYNNDPHAQFVHKSSPHEGVAFLDLEYDASPDRLTGRYYTARRTTGDLDVKRKKR
jgi:hypothetical protein